MGTSQVTLLCRVLIVEALAQVGGVALLNAEEFKGRLAF